MKHLSIILAALLLTGCGARYSGPEQHVITGPAETTPEPFPWEEEYLATVPGEEPWETVEPEDTPTRMGSPPPVMAPPPPPPAAAQQPPGPLSGMVDWMMNEHPLGMGRTTPTVEGSLPSTTVADAVLDQLTMASLAFAIPSQTNVKTRIRAQLLIDLQLDPTALAEDLSVEGEEFTGRVLVSRVVMANLTAPGFEVQSITPNRQAISMTESTEWLWYLTPKTAGKHDVFVTVTAFVYADDANFVERHIRTFERVISVEVRAEQVAWDWFKKNWQWFLTVLLLPLLRYLWKRYKK